MSEVYEIKHVAGPKEWSGKYGPMLSYTLDLDHDGVVERAVELARKPESRAPEIGELVALDLEDGPYGTKAKLDFERTKELPQNGVQMRSRKPSPHEVSSGSKGSWTPESERDPERAARILRQHSQEMALRFVAYAGTTGPADFETMWCDDFLKPIIDWFDQDVLQAGKRASEGTKTGSTPPPETASEPPSPSSPDVLPVTHQELTEALDTAGVTIPAQRDAIAGYMAAELPTERIVKAVGNLVLRPDDGDPDPTAKQARTLKALKKATEEFTGKPLPQGDAFDSDPDKAPF